MHGSKTGVCERWGILHGMERNGAKVAELLRYKPQNGTML